MAITSCRHFCFPKSARRGRQRHPPCVKIDGWDVNPDLTGYAVGSNMILKGNQRAGGQQLAAHLQNSFDNERVEIADVRGSVAQDLSGAFAEWAAEARGTKCTKFLYSLSLNPYQPNGRLTREQYLDLLERTERSLKLVGQPRAVVFHEKRDKDGVLREHCHAVWSRIDTDRMRAVPIWTGSCANTATRSGRALTPTK